MQEQLAHYLQPHVLVIDEVGYLSYGLDAANVLFHIVNERHQRGRPMLFTTNKPPLTAWGEVLHDHDLAEAIVDRVLENGRLLLLDGPSYRTRHLDLPAQDAHDVVNQPARISGNQPAEFPEPTAVILGGSIIIESVFALPGVGRLVVNAALRRDYPVIQGSVTYLVGISLLVNLLVDLSYAVINPRITYE